MSKQEDKKRIEEALSYSKDDMYIKQLKELIKIHNANTNNDKYLYLNLNSKLKKWENSDREECFSETISATLLVNNKRLFTTSTEYTSEYELSPKQRKYRLNDNCGLILLAIVKYGIDTEREEQFLISNTTI